MKWSAATGHGFSTVSTSMWPATTTPPYLGMHRSTFWPSCAPGFWSPTASQEALIAQLRAEIEGLKTQVQTLSQQVQKLTAEKTSLSGQIQTLQAQNAGLALQIKNLDEANRALKSQLSAADAEKLTLQKRIAELEARIAELTKGDKLSVPQIKDIVDALPKHSTSKYDTRARSKITTLAIHHSAAGGDVLPQAVATYHVRKGWPGIGYHFYITADGTIYQCNRLESVSYHSGYANTYSVGICLAGSFMNGATPPDNQMAAATHLVAHLTKELNIRLENVKGHKELPQTSTACPGSEWLQGQKWKDRFLAAVKAKLG
jgi:chaperonin cofactor prefoldin